jgi:hypothetical protein
MFVLDKSQRAADCEPLTDLKETFWTLPIRLPVSFRDQSKVALTAEIG